MILEQIKLLVSLSRADGEMASLERRYIINIGKAHGLPSAEIEPLFHQVHEGIISQSLTADQRFNYIFNLVELMKIDGRLYKEEIKFCAHIAGRLGYAPEAMFELLLKVQSGTMDDEAKAALKASIAKHLD